MKEQELLINALEKEKKVRQAIKKKSSDSVIFQPLFFVGEKYNQELLKLAQKNGATNMNFIDFGKIETTEKADGGWIEKEIGRICKNCNKDEEFPLLCFLNINKISGTALEKALLPFFDSHQNFQHKDLDLSPFILIATSSISRLEKISPPLLSRLKCINQNEAELPKTFLDRHFNLVLISSFLLLLALLWLIFSPKKNRVQTKK